jgi:hypothetical protein
MTSDLGEKAKQYAQDQRERFGISFGAEEHYLAGATAALEAAGSLFPGLMGEQARKAIRSLTPTSP